MKTYANLVSAATARPDDFLGKKLSETISWLGDVITPPVSLIIENTIDNLRNKEPEYEPLLYDLYLGEAASALDRCLTLRREIQELEATALSFARQYTRFERTSVIDKQIEDPTNVIVQANHLEKGFQEAGKLIKADASSQIAGGMKKQSEVIAESHRMAAEELARKKELQNSRWEILEKINDAEQAQHTTPGHALNFRERRDRLIDLLKIDLTEAYRKCIATKEGIRVIYSNTFQSSLPTSTSENALDQLLKWVRDAIEFLERQREREIDFDIVVPLIQSTKDRVGSTYSVGANVAIIKDPANGLFVINLKPWLDKYFGDAGPGKPRISALRLKAIGASVSTDMNEDKQSRTSVWNFIVFPPTTQRVLDASLTDFLVRPPIILGDVRGTGTDRGVSFEDGPNVRNQQIYGEWRIRVMPQVSTGFAGEANRVNMPATDIKLHIRATGIPINDLAGW